MSANENSSEVRIPVPWGFVAGCWYGDRRTRPILALHGWLDNAGSFAPLAPLIAPHRPVLAIDFPGHGRSSHFPTGVAYHTDDFVSVIQRIVSYYKWTHVSLIGHSMGAVCSFQYTALFPHLVDMVIGFDGVKMRYCPPSQCVSILNPFTENLLIDDERLLRIQNAVAAPEPRTYSFAQLEKRQHEGSDFSVDMKQAKYLLERSTTQSLKHPDKYYFTRDGRTKYYFEFYPAPELAVEMARRICNVNYLVLQAEHSDFLTPNDEVIKVLRSNNPNFQWHELPNTTHHLHLNNPQLVARYVVPFVLNHQPKDDQSQLTSVGELSKL